jgi:hypothetical protein
MGSDSYEEGCFKFSMSDLCPFKIDRGDVKFLEAL